MLESPSTLADTAVNTGDRSAVLEVENTELRARLEARDQRIRLLEEALRVLKANTYGPSRERLSVAAGQVELFNEIEATLDITEAVGMEPELKATPLREDKSAGGKPGRTKLASHLPRVEIRHELTEAERQCGCGGVLAEIGADVSEQIDYVPAKVQVLRHVRVKYACPGCEQCVKTAALPEHILPKTNASPGLLAQLVTSKYVDSLPLYRQEAMFERYGVRLPRATQAAWMIGLNLPLQPLLNLMDERLRSSGYVRIDETRVQVLNSDKAPSALHWMWVRVAGPKHQRIILFDYDPSRGGEVADGLIEGCSGYLQSDGYQAYEGVSARAGLIHVGCFAHARRRFFEALKALPNAQRKQASAAHEAVRRIDALYLIERQIKDLDDEGRTRIRRDEAVPQLASLHEWANRMQHETMPSGKLGEALGYLITQWPKLVRYVEDPRLAIDTNLAENSIRPFALGRRNWLFADTVKGAKASAALYSIVSTARANGLEPYAYLRRLFAELPKAKTVEDFEALLPFNTAPHSQLPLARNTAVFRSQT
jgi:transposase